MTANDSSTATLERHMSVSELSRATGVPKRTIYDAIERGSLVCFVPNGCRRGFRIPESEATRWMNNKRSNA